jgi:hypothetical protein
VELRLTKNEVNGKNCIICSFMVWNIIRIVNRKGNEMGRTCSTHLIEVLAKFGKESFKKASRKS